MGKAEASRGGGGVRRGKRPEARALMGPVLMFKCKNATISATHMESTSVSLSQRKHVLDSCKKFLHFFCKNP